MSAYVPMSDEPDPRRSPDYVYEGRAGCGLLAVAGVVMAAWALASVSASQCLPGPGGPPKVQVVFYGEAL